MAPAQLVGAAVPPSGVAGSCAMADRDGRQHSSPAGPPEEPPVGRTAKVGGCRERGAARKSTNLCV